LAAIGISVLVITNNILEVIGIHATQYFVDLIGQGRGLASLADRTYGADVRPRFPP
jgi:hypothetical protein